MCGASKMCHRVLALEYKLWTFDLLPPDAATVVHATKAPFDEITMLKMMRMKRPSPFVVSLSWENGSGVRTAQFFGAPVGCWRTRRRVESSDTSLKSVPLVSAANRRCHTPLFDPSPKRWYTLFLALKACGRSSYDTLVRAIHSAASTNSRLSLPRRMRTPSLPEKYVLDLFHLVVARYLLHHRANSAQGY